MLHLLNRLPIPLVLFVLFSLFGGGKVNAETPVPAQANQSSFSTAIVITPNGTIAIGASFSDNGLNTSAFANASSTLLLNPDGSVATFDSGNAGGNTSLPQPIFYTIYNFGGSI